MRNFNLCSASDSYKFQHWNMYPEKTEIVYSYFEARKGAMFASTQFATLQFFIKEYLLPGFTEKDMLQAKARVNAHLGEGAFNEAGWQYILDKYNGKLPVVIKAVPEGMSIPIDNVLFTIENTDPKCFWLTSYLETILTHVWAGSTVATLSKSVKTMMSDFLARTSDRPEAIAFMLHDFGFRGVSSFQSAAAAGLGHIINFMGTDTFAAVDCAMDDYSATDMPAYSVPATEHSVMTAKGRDGEMDIVKDLLQNYPVGILSMVIDSYDYRAFIRNTGKLYRDVIEARGDITAPDGTLIAPGKTVFRPDSGDPVKTSLEVFGLLEEAFGSTPNSKGFRVLNPKVGMLWGDGIGPEGIGAILAAFEDAKIAACNIVFGMGGGLLQKVNRDTQCFAFKSSYQVRDGQGFDIFKDPIDGSKKSKAGRLVLVNDNGEYKTLREEEYVAGFYGADILEEVFRDGVLVRDMTFEEVRANAA